MKDNRIIKTQAQFERTKQLVQGVLIYSKIQEDKLRELGHEKKYGIIFPSMAIVRYTEMFCLETMDIEESQNFGQNYLEEYPDGKILGWGWYLRSEPY